LFAAASVALISLTAPAFAGEREVQLERCVSALDAQGLAAIDAYRAKFVKGKGGSVQTIVLKLIPLADGPSIEAECVLKRGEVTSATLKS
jgi:hypothetical protein